MLNLRSASLEFVIKLLFEPVVSLANSRGNVEAEWQARVCRVTPDGRDDQRHLG